jgi:phosphatidylglycerol:prolipoprotein diacylglycerol transferase
MNGIVINIDPVLWSYGTFELRWYSLMIMLAVIAAVLISAYLGKKKGIATGEIYSLALWVVFGGVVGARLFHVIDQWEYYAGNPLQILQLQQGGLAIWGALVGGGLAVVYLGRRNHIPLGRLVDAVAPGLLVAQIIGRVGCIINGDAYGGTTSLPWAFIYVHPNALIPSNLFALPTHPYPVYEIAWNVLALFILWRLGRYFQRDGLVFLSYLSLYSLGRFILTFVRQENITFLGLQQAQIIAIHVIVVSVVAMVYLFRKRLVPERITQK